MTPDDDRVVSDVKELLDVMLASGKPQACLARNYFRYTYSRWEDEGQAAPWKLCALRSTAVEV